MAGMGRFPSRRLPAVAVAVAALVGFGTVSTFRTPARATWDATSTTTTTRPPEPGVFTPTVSPDTVANHWGCSRPTTATIATGTTGKVDNVTFRVQLGGRTSLLSATPSGSRWSANFDGGTFFPDHGSGTVRAVATGPSGRAESGDAPFTLTDCRP
jgi:hypothetical protein